MSGPAPETNGYKRNCKTKIKNAIINAKLQKP